MTDNKIALVVSNLNPHRRIALLILALAALLSLDCGKKTLQSNRLLQPLHVDGVSSDWETANLLIDEDLQVVYSLANTDSFFYLLIRFNDPRLAQQMGAQGLTFWLDKKKTRGIRYFEQSMRDRFIDRLMSAASGGRQARDVHPSADSTLFAMQGRFYRVEGELVVPLNSVSGGPLAAAGYHNGVYCLEYAIPLQGSTGQMLLDVDKKGEFFARVSVEKLDDSIRKHLEKRMKIGPGEKPQQGEPGRGGMSGGGMGRPGGGMGIPNSAKRSSGIALDGNTFAFKVRLAKGD